MKLHTKASEAPMAGCQAFPAFDQSFESPRAPAYAGPRKGLAPSSKPRSSIDGKQLNKSEDANRILLLGRVQELALYRAEVLQDRGFEVRVSTNREEALKLIRRGDFDAVVLSYTLSSDTVEELAEEIREYRPQCPLVVIAKTKYPDRKIVPDAVALADDGPKALISALRRVLRRQ
jgi:CheY-like chemotaxis protein